MGARRSPGWDDAMGVAAQARAIRRRIVPLVQSDADAYAASLAALAAIEDAPGSGRDEAIASALAGAADVALAIARAGTDTAFLAELVADRGEPSGRDDAQAAAVLAEAGTRVAAALVAANLVTAEGRRPRDGRSLVRAVGGVGAKQDGRVTGTAMDWASVSDGEVVRACRAGDDAAWRELVERFSRYVLAIARAHRLSESDAEDVFQDTFARIYEHLGRLRSDDAVRPWIGQLTRRLCIDRLRAAAREPVADDPEEQGELDRRLTSVDEAVSVQEALQDALGRLPRDPRPVLLPRPELSHDRRAARPAARNDRKPHLTLPREAP